MDSKTLREVCKELGVSRRAVQGYEKAGLVSATGKNKYGHLLYNEMAQERIKRIRLYHQFGFKIREIGRLLESSGEELRAELEKQVRILELERQEKEELIRKAYELIENLDTRQNRQAEQLELTVAELKEKD